MRLSKAGTWFLKKYQTRSQIAPFEVGLSWIVVASGIAGLLNFGIIDPRRAVLPDGLAYIVNVAYALSGVAILIGFHRRQRQLEGAGLILLIATALAQWLVYLVYLGVTENFFVSGVYYAAIVWMAASRMAMLRSGDVIVRVQRDLTIRETH